MAFEPSKITREHVLAAVKKIEEEKILLWPSTRWEVIINDRAYPPKEIMRYAHELMNGEYIWAKSGGEPTNTYLAKMGFKINHMTNTNPIRSIFEKLKAAVHADGKLMIKKQKYDDQKDKYWIWFGDQQELIGKDDAHYEVLWEKDLISVDLHFEGTSKSKRRFQTLIEGLQDPLQSIPWQKYQSIRHGTGIPLSANVLKTLVEEELIAQLKDQLYLLDSTIGSKVRAILDPTNKKEFSKRQNMDMPLNQILYGPPGTGKTFNSINKALEILGENLEGKTRAGIKVEFDRKVEEGQIIFTTFHQSMSYEDFIEGIKPLEPSQAGAPVTYKVVPGIFKRACALAAYHFYHYKKQDLTQEYSFDDLYEAFIAYVRDKIKAQQPLVYKTLRGRDIEIKEINSNGSVIARAKSSVAQSSAPLTKENLQKLYDQFQSIEDIKELRQIKEVVQIMPRITEFYAIFKGLKDFEHEQFKPDVQSIQEAKEAEPLDIEAIQKKFDEGVYNPVIQKNENEDLGKVPKVVLIIDEINRGNVSQIFGELITLIEEDKRIGKAEALELTLPYSKNKFSIPPNLYIIGTMNTADRSVEALDTALRRRFSFIEMPPDPRLIASKGKLKDENGICSGINLEQLLFTINNRIEKLLDRDHQIGHSYFMSVSNLDELKLAYQNKIIPLLQEYFFGDYGKIGLVLGKGFVRKKEDERLVFAKFDDYDDSADLAERKVFELIHYESSKGTDTSFIEAIKQLINKSEPA